MTTTEDISYNANPKDPVDGFIEAMYRQYLEDVAHGAQDITGAALATACCDEHADILAELYGQFELLDNQTGLDVETVVKLVRERIDSNRLQHRNAARN
jgi:hypothetical protein